ncbi:tRNA adenosine(34) deaminase TadA [Pseudohongiella spirulinae]
MQQALALAARAAELGEVPVGAVLVKDGQVIGQGFNQPVRAHDVTAHAEIQALRDAGQHLGNYRLPGTTLYVTIEPCTMCYGAIVHARVQRLVFGATEPKYGAVVSGQQLAQSGRFNHQPQISSGILAGPCGQMMRDFFAQRRLQGRQTVTRP